jgi:lipopolysaccharide biosynthesis regulator YciM
MLRNGGERETAILARYRASIGEMALRQGALEEAKRHFKAALKLERDQPVALLRLGDIYAESGHAERAILLWKGLAGSHPGRAHLVVRRLEASYFQRGRFSEMEQTYEELLVDNPRDVRVLLALARLHVKRGALEEALLTLRRVLEVAPDSAPARLLTVQVLRQQGELPRALDEVEETLKSLAEGAATVCGRCGRPFEEYWSRCPDCLAWIPLPAA